MKISDERLLGWLALHAGSHLPHIIEEWTIITELLVARKLVAAIRERRRLWNPHGSIQEILDHYNEL